MSTHRNIDRVCIVVLVLTLLLTVAFINGERLGIRVIADEDAESYAGSAYFTENDLDGAWADNAYTTCITLDGSGGRIDGNGAYFLNGDLVISEGGWYVLSGTLDDGGIVVDAHDSSKIWLRLNGVTVDCSDDACLRIDQADKVFLTLAEDTENVFTSGGSYSAEALSDNTGGAIFAHDDLTINGSGSLTVTAGYKHGIDANDSLVITGGKLTITAPQDGVHVNDSFRFANASLTLDVGDDGIHSDSELYIESGDILISSCYEGIEAITIDVAGGDITIYPEDDGLNANGSVGMMGNAMPMSQDFAGGEMPEQPGASQTEAAEVSEEETYIRISGGSLTIINETGRDADGLDSNGSIYLDGGDIHISLLSDGGNCAIDYGSESGGECVVTGGTVLAFGGSSMTEEFSAGSTQCAVLYNLNSAVQAGALFRVLNAAGEELISCTPECSYSSAAFSAPELAVGETYTVTCGDSSAELTLESTATSAGASGGMGSMQFGGRGGTQTGNEEGTPPGGMGELPTDDIGDAPYGGMGERPSGGMDGMRYSGRGGMRPGLWGGTQGDAFSGQDGETASDRPTPPDGEMGTPPQWSGDGAVSFPGRTDESGDTEAESGETSQQAAHRGGDRGEMNGFASEGRTDAEQTETASGSFVSLQELDGEVWILLGASVLVLAAAIGFAMMYRKRS